MTRDDWYGVIMIVGVCSLISAFALWMLQGG